MKKELKIGLMLLLGLGLAACGKLTERTVAPHQPVINRDSVSVREPGVGVEASYADQQWWRSLSQGQRNDLIAQKAYDHMVSLGGGVNKFSSPSGYNCKTWVQSYVVPRASRYVASIPANSGPCRWYPGQYVRIVGYGPAGIPINAAVRGQIVQAGGVNSLHTMIVWLCVSSGVWVIDCNYNLAGSLTIHYFTYSKFESMTGGCYTVYEVIGG
jgi:hypothetical protein